MIAKIILWLWKSDEKFVSLMESQRVINCTNSGAKIFFAFRKFFSFSEWKSSLNLKHFRFLFRVQNVFLHFCSCNLNLLSLYQMFFRTHFATKCLLLSNLQNIWREKKTKVIVKCLKAKPFTCFVSRRFWHRVPKIKWITYFNQFPVKTLTQILKQF